MLIVPLQGEVVLVTRAMERVTVANQVRNARFEGHGDHETAADAAARVLLALGPRVREIGTEQWSSGLPDGLAKALARALPQVRWHDISGQIDRTRLVKRSEEHTSELQSLMRISYAVFCLKKKKQHDSHATLHTATSPQT